MPDLATSIVGTVIQSSGAVLVTVLLLILRRSFGRRFLAYWAAGWAGMAAALGTLVAGFIWPAVQSVAYPVYCFA